MVEKLTLAAVTRAMGAPPPQWKGQCTAVCSHVLEAGLVEGDLIHGMWVGEFSPKGYFASRAHMGMTQHTWILLKDGVTIVDPTRWVFEAKRPYIFVSKDVLTEPYDEGGARVKESQLLRFRVPWPEDGVFGGTSKKPSNLRELVSAATLEALLLLIEGYDPGASKTTLAKCTPFQLMWLGSMPYHWYGDVVASDLYLALDKLGRRAVVPIDSWHRAERWRRRQTETAK